MADEQTTRPTPDENDDRTTAMSTDETREIPRSSEPTASTNAGSTSSSAPAGSTPASGTPSAPAGSTPTSSAPTSSYAPAEQEPAPRRRVGWHDTDVTSLVFGLLFLGIAAVWLLVQQDVVSWPDASRIFPIVLVAAGVIGLVSSLTRSRRSRRDERPYPPA